VGSSSVDRSLHKIFETTLGIYEDLSLNADFKPFLDIQISHTN
jgi:hypothetical protein